MISVDEAVQWIVSAFVLVMLSLAVYGASGNFNLAG